MRSPGPHSSFLSQRAYVLKLPARFRRVAVLRLATEASSVGEFASKVSPLLVAHLPHVARQVEVPRVRVHGVRCDDACLTFCKLYVVVPGVDAACVGDFAHGLHVVYVHRRATLAAPTSHYTNIHDYF